jgi:hypothetical protein
LLNWNPARSKNFLKAMSWRHDSMAVNLCIAEVVVVTTSQAAPPDCDPPLLRHVCEPIHLSAHSVNLWTLAAASAFNTSPPLHSSSLSRNLTCTKNQRRHQHHPQMHLL